MQAATISALGQRRQALLSALLEARDGGLNADELAERLEISRSAVHQHLTLLERDGYIEKLVRPSTGGRPGHAWQLTDKGDHLFPKQYALFSELMIRAIEKSLGNDGLVRVLEELGAGVAESYAPRLRPKPPAQRIRAVADIMRELGYQARTAPDGQRRLPLIEAYNCVFHHLADEHPEVCRLDLALLARLSGANVEHTECMLRGGAACRFRFRRGTPRE